MASLSQDGAMNAGEWEAKIEQDGKGKHMKVHW
jgi:hypothetical protein